MMKVAKVVAVTTKRPLRERKKWKMQCGKTDEVGSGFRRTSRTAYSNLKYFVSWYMRPN